MSPTESNITDIGVSSYHKYEDVRSKVINGEYKIKNKRGKSRLWDLFGRIENKRGEEIPDLVVCRSCYSIYKYNKNSLSNLNKHKCYVTLRATIEGPKVNADPDSKENVANSIAEWVIGNCRSYELVEDSGFKKVVDVLLSVGEKFGRHIDLNSLLPKSSYITRSVNKAYNINFEKLKTEIAKLKNNGFGLTADVYNDNYLKKYYIAVTIHYINEGNLTNRVLGLKPLEGANIALEILKILKTYDLEFHDNIIIVTNPNTDINRECINHLCINHLLYNALEKTMQEILDIAELSYLCKQLVRHFKSAYPDSNLISTLISFPTHHWNKIYNLYVSIESNWSEIVQLLIKKHELINNVNLKHINAIVEILKPFQETFEKLQADKNATIHLVYVCIHHLKKKCVPAKADLKLIKQLKEKLSCYLDSMVLNKLTIYHKIGLFLFPPANKLKQFSDDERLLIKEECKRTMKSYLHDVPEPDIVMVMTDISNDNSELFSDFVNDQDNINSMDKISNEMLLYENKSVRFHDDFNVLQWWDLHKHEFPLLYKVSCKILATPATCAASVKVFSLARTLISEEKTDIASNDAAINEIMFLHLNVDTK